MRLHFHNMTLALIFPFVCTSLFSLHYHILSLSLILRDFFFILCLLLKYEFLSLTFLSVLPQHKTFFILLSVLPLAQHASHFLSLIPCLHCMVMCVTFRLCVYHHIWWWGIIVHVVKCLVASCWMWYNDWLHQSRGRLLMWYKSCYLQSRGWLLMLW